MGSGVKALENTVLKEFLGADGVEELKTKVIDMIVETIRDQLDESSYFIINPDDISNEIHDRVIDAIYEEIKEEYKEKISELVQKKIGVLGI